MRRSIATFLLAAGGTTLVLGLAGSSGCGSSETTDATSPAAITLTDGGGHAVHFASPPQRIATTASFAVDLLVALDHPPILRPDLPTADVPAAARDIPTWAVSHSVGPNLEQLVAANADLVITTPMFARYRPAIEDRLGVPVAILSIRELADIGPTARWLGRLLGAAETGNQLAQQLEQAVNTVRPPREPTAPQVFAIFGTPQSSLAFLPDSYFGSLIEHLGGDLITAGAAPAAVSQQFTPLSLEYVIEHDPDVIFVVRHGPPEQQFTELTGHPAWAALRAVRNGRVHVLSHRRYVTNPGPSAVAALRELRALLYPPGPDA
jgi:iron complex transport system substrate-binding protein